MCIAKGLELHGYKFVDAVGSCGAESIKGKIFGEQAQDEDL